MDIKELFFRLLRTALWSGEVVVEVDEVSRDTVMGALRIAKSQTVLGLVANEVLKTDSLSALLTDGDKAGLKRFVMSNLATGQMLNNTLVSIVRELRKHGIDPVLLKGQGIAKYYPLPELRQCGDIDIYVGQEKFAKTCEVIGAMSTPEDHQGDNPSLKHFHTRIGKAFIEIHRYTDVYFPNRLDRVYQKVSDEGMSAGLVPLDFAGVQVMSPSVDFNMFFIFNHFWHHFIADGVGLRQVCDWALLLHANRGKVNEAYLSDVLVKMGLMKQWQVFGCLAVEVLGLPQDEMPFYDAKYSRLASKVLDLMLLEGNFGHEKQKSYNRPKGYIAGKLYSFRRHSQRNLSVLRLFPKEALRQWWKVLVVGVAVVFDERFRRFEED